MNQYTKFEHEKQINKENVIGFKHAHSILERVVYNDHYIGVCWFFVRCWYIETIN